MIIAKAILTIITISIISLSIFSIPSIKEAPSGFFISETQEPVENTPTEETSFKIQPIQEPIEDAPAVGDLQLFLQEVEPNQKKIQPHHKLQAMLNQEVLVFLK